MTGLLPWLLVALLLSTWFRRTHIIDWQESVPGRVGDVVDVFADIDRYGELLPKGALSESGFVDRWEDRSPDGARHQIDHFRLKTKLGTIYGNRHYRRSADGKKVTVHIYFDEATFFEFSNELWIFEQSGDRTNVRASGTRRAPWFFAWYSNFHSRGGAILIRKIGSLLAEEAARP